MNVLRNRFLWVGLLVAFVCVLVPAFLALRGLRAAGVAERSALETMAAVDAVDGTLQDTASGQTTFLVTGDKESLAPYADADTARPGQLARLDELLGKEPEVEPRLKHLHELVEQRVALARASVQQVERGDRDGAVEVAKRGDPTKLSQGIRGELKELRAFAQQRADQASAARDDSGGSLMLWLIFLGVLGLATGGIGFYVVHSDSSASEDTEHHFHASEEQFHLVSELTADLVRFHDADDQATYVNGAAAELLGMTREEVVALPPRWLIHPEELGAALAYLQKVDQDQRIPLVHRMRQKAGGFRWFETRTRRIRTAGDARTRYASVSRDLTERRRNDDLNARHNDELQKLTFRDPTTGLYNRRGLAEMAEKLIAFAARSGRIAGVILVGVNGVRAIHERGGRDQAQRILTEMSRVIVESCRNSDVVAFLGNDEFAVLAMEVTAESVAALTARIEASITELNARKDRVGALSISVGAAFSMPEGSSPLGAMLSEAKTQMEQERQLRVSLGL